MTKCQLTVEADRDLFDIYLYGLQTFGLRQAEHYQDVLSEKLNLLAENPSFGADYGDICKNLRRDLLPESSLIVM